MTRNFLKGGNHTNLRKDGKYRKNFGNGDIKKHGEFLELFKELMMDLLDSYKNLVNIS